MLKTRLLNTGIFEDNQYLDNYVNLIEINRDTLCKRCETNKHHIIPRHYYKAKNLPLDNSKENLVNLRYRDHMLAHFYLSGCTFGQNKYWNLYAITRMSGQKYCSSEEREFIENLEDYQKIYAEAIAAAPNHRKGTKVSDETLERMRAAAQNRAKTYGSPGKGCKWMNNGSEEHMVKLNEIDTYLENGYTFGRIFSPSEESRKARSEKCRRPRSAEFCQKMKEIAKTRKPHSEESFKKQSTTMKEYYKTHHGTFFGRTHSDEAKEKNRLAHIGLKTLTDGIKTRRLRPEEEIQELLAQGWRFGTSVNTNHLGKIWINDGNKCRCIAPEDLDEYISQGYVKGKLSKRKTPEK